MDTATLKTLVSDAELVAGAAASLGKLQDGLLHRRISEANIALANANSDDASQDLAYGALQIKLSEALTWLHPVTLFDLHACWDPKTGFRIKRPPLYFFWALSILLMFAVGYLTQWHERAVDTLRTSAQLHAVRLSEQGIKLHNFALTHLEEIIAKPKAGQPALALDAFAQAWGNLQELQFKFGDHGRSVSDAQNEISPGYLLTTGMCGFLAKLAMLVGKTYDCSATFSQFAQGIAPRTPNGPYSNQPPSEDSSILTIAAARGRTNPEGPAEAEFARFHRHIDDVQQFLYEIGLTGINLRTNTLQTPNVRELRSSINVVRLWLLPAFYGALGAALFFMRRFMNTMLPNPPTGQVIYRILLGGFAGIVFAWFWSPFQPQADGLPIASLSAFSIAFLAGYGTDILFRVLDKLLDMANQQLQGGAPSSPAKIIGDSAR